MTSVPRAGTVIDNKYRLDHQIGQGGMGAVFSATQLAVDRKVAIKLLHASFASQHNVKARFEVEARAIARLNHPNCITLYDFGHSQELGAFYTVVEYIHGQSLDALIGQDNSLHDLLVIVRQIASALDHAHHHGILHRDLKPENIMLARMTDGTETVKVLDFGIAQIMTGNGGEDDDFEADRITRVGEVFGTPAYMSPEQARSARDLTPASDLYSLGVIFYELASGRLPFFCDNPLDILTMHLHEPPPPLPVTLPTEVRAIIERLLLKDPAARPASGRELVAMIDAALASLPASTAALPAGPPPRLQRSNTTGERPAPFAAPPRHIPTVSTPPSGVAGVGVAGAGDALHQTLVDAHPAAPTQVGLSTGERLAPGARGLAPASASSSGAMAPLAAMSTDPSIPPVLTKPDGAVRNARSLMLRMWVGIGVVLAGTAALVLWALRSPAQAPDAASVAGPTVHAASTAPDFARAPVAADDFDTAAVPGGDEPFASDDAPSPTAAMDLAPGAREAEEIGDEGRDDRAGDHASGGPASAEAAAARASAEAEKTEPARTTRTTRPRRRTDQKATTRDETARPRPVKLNLSDSDGPNGAAPRRPARHDL